KSNFIVRRDQRPPVFGRENEMVKKIGVRVGHAPSVTSLSMKISCKGYRPLVERVARASARSARQRKAWGEAKRTPGTRSNQLVSPRSGRQPFQRICELRGSLDDWAIARSAG